jgi:hypothetical protein
MNPITSQQFRPGRARSRNGWILAALLLPGTLSTAAQSGGPTNTHDFSAFKIISERNIFDPNRRPRIAASPAAKIVDSFSLAGTMIFGKSYYSVFDGTSSDYRKVLERGGAIAGHTVTHIGLDSVKLSSGTNLLEVKVGMQMRRNEDGQWSIGEQSESPLTAYASDSSRRQGNRRRADGAGPSNAAPGDAARALPPAGGPGLGEASPGTDGPESELTNAPPEPAGGDSNDPVARMMRRRAQELNANDNRTPNQ